MKLALYARVSTKTQEKKQTIDSQVVALREFACTRGDTVAEESIFLDDGVSGATLARRGLDRLRDAAEAGQFDAVVAHSPDRLSRKYAYLILILEEFERLGVPILFLEQPPGDDPHTILLTQIQGAVAEYERAKLAERYRRGKLHCAKQGEVFWKAPFGYRRIPRRDGTPAHLVIDTDQAAVVRSIFQSHVNDNVSIRQITKNLTRLGVVPPRGGRVWGESTVHKILHSETYTGTLYYNRSQLVALSPAEMAQTRTSSGVRRVSRAKEDWIALSIPAIIERALFERSQARHESNTQFSPRRLKEERWLLRRLLRCRGCGYKFACVGLPRRSGQPHVDYYRCGRLSDNATRGRCSRTHVQAMPLDRVVWNEIREHLLNPELLLTAQQQLGTAGGVDEGFLESQVRGAQQRLRQAQSERGRLLDAFQAGHLEKKEFESRICKVRARVDGLDADLRALEDEHRRAQGGKEFLLRIEGFTRTVTGKLDKMSFHERQALARTLLDEVVLDGRDVTLHFKIPLPKPGPKAPVTENVAAGKALSNEFILRSRADEDVEVNVGVEIAGGSVDRGDRPGIGVLDVLEAQYLLGLPAQELEYDLYGSLDELGQERVFEREGIPQWRRESQNNVPDRIVTDDAFADEGATIDHATQETPWAKRPLLAGQRDR